MIVNPVPPLDATVEITHVWFHDLAEDGHFVDDLHAYSGFCAVMHALRDRLRVEDAAQLAAQLPMRIRDMFFEEWKPAETPPREPTLQDFLEHVREKLGSIPVDPKTATSAVFRLLEEKITLGEMQNIRPLLPTELHELLAPRGTFPRT